MNTEHIIVIPARYASTRFPGKPLATIAGKSMIRRVWERCAAAACTARVIVATDDERIEAEIASFGGESMMTPPELASGSERMAWVAERIGGAVFINVQGDEPLMPPATIDAVAEALLDSDADIATAACPILDSDAMSNPNVVKLVTDRDGNALYFSRAPIPFDRDADAAHAQRENTRQPGNGFGENGVYLKHIGIYAFRRDALLRFAALPPGRLEQIEKLEQLRAMENGMRIRVARVPSDSQAVDTPDDVPIVEELIRKYI
ncbi:MAG: 3-deoxy-manno-octulosonate cytidylyltransferase [Bacteroidetes bacterium]|nr:3-deoxy-manno-octulosonate cytidylyltransferase [Bacteroidota bacterium]